MTIFSVSRNPDATSDDVRYQDAPPTTTPFELAAPRGANQVCGRKSTLRRPKAAPMPSATPPVYDFSIQADTSWRDDTERNRACADKNWSDHSYQAKGGTTSDHGDASKGSNTTVSDVSAEDKTADADFNASAQVTLSCQCQRIPR